MKKIIFTGFCFLIVLGSLAQSKNKYSGFPSLIWPKLYDISFIKGTDKLGEFDKPVFSTSTIALAGKPVTLPGYMVPFTEGIKGNHFILTSLPLNACFFCGVGGPESVVEIFLKKEVTYTEKPVEIHGTLKLNDKNPDQMMYVLEHAEFLGEIDY